MPPRLLAGLDIGDLGDGGALQRLEQARAAFPYVETYLGHARFGADAGEDQDWRSRLRRSSYEGIDYIWHLEDAERRDVQAFLALIDEQKRKPSRYFLDTEGLAPQVALDWLESAEVWSPGTAWGWFGPGTPADSGGRQHLWAYGGLGDFGEPSRGGERLLALVPPDFEPLPSEQEGGRSAAWAEARWLSSVLSMQVLSDLPPLHCRLDQLMAGKPGRAQAQPAAGVLELFRVLVGAASFRTQAGGVELLEGEGKPRLRLEAAMEDLAGGRRVVLAAAEPGGDFTLLLMEPLTQRTNRFGAGRDLDSEGLALSWDGAKPGVYQVEVCSLSEAAGPQSEARAGGAAWLHGRSLGLCRIDGEGRFTGPAALSVPSQGMSLLRFGRLGDHPDQGSGRVSFVDVSKESGVDRSEATFAVAAADYDRDGWIDLAVSNHGPKGVLLRNRGGLFEDRSLDIPFRASDTHGLSWVDLDDDGWLDLYITCGADRGRGQGENFVFRSQLGRSFEQVRWGAVLEDPQGRGRVAVPLDLDGDGRLELLIQNLYQEGRGHRLAWWGGGEIQDVASEVGISELGAQQLTAFHPSDAPDPVFVAFGPGPDSGRCYRWRAGRFEEHSSELGVRPQFFTRDLALGDYDNDGDLDLFVAAGHDKLGAIEVDRGGVRFFLTEFRPGEPQGFDLRVDGELGIDVRSDGWYPPDSVFLGAERSPVAELPLTLEAGDPRLMGDPGLGEADHGCFCWVDEEGVFHLRGVGGSASLGELAGSISAPSGYGLLSAAYASGPSVEERCVLYENRDGTFVDVTRAAGLVGVGPALSATFADFNNDSHLDLYLLRGHERYGNSPNSLYLGGPGGAFEEVTEESGAAGAERGRGDAAVAFDYDNDGGLDLFLINGQGSPPGNDGPYQLLRNESPRGNWIQVDPVGTQSNRMGIGARVRVRDGDFLQVAERVPLGTRFGHSQLPLHFGLGGRSEVWVEVLWPSGVRSEARLAAGQRVQIVEPEVSSGASR